MAGPESREDPFPDYTLLRHGRNGPNIKHLSQEALINLYIEDVGQLLDALYEREEKEKRKRREGELTPYAG